MEEKRKKRLINEMVQNSPKENFRLFAEHEFIRDELHKRGRMACNCMSMSHKRLAERSEQSSSSARL